MSRSRSRLAADWFAKLRVNSATQAVEHTDVEVVEAATTTALTAKADTTYVDTAIGNIPPSNDASALTTGTLPAGRFPATLPATTVDLGNWTVTESSGVLYFATSGTNKMKLDASGNLTVTGNVTGYGTV